MENKMVTAYFAVKNKWDNDWKMSLTLWGHRRIQQILGIILLLHFDFKSAYLLYEWGNHSMC